MRVIDRRRTANVFVTIGSFVQAGPAAALPRSFPRHGHSTSLFVLTAFAPMAETAAPIPVRANETAGHLHVHVEGAHPPEVPFLFEQQRKRLGPAFVVSLACHLAMFALLVLAITSTSRRTTTAPALPGQPPSGVIWLKDPGPGGGGGGGGDHMKEPPRQAQLPGKDRMTVPVAKRPKLEDPREAKNEPALVEPLDIPAKSLAAGVESMVGVIERPPGPPTVSQGPGSANGAGSTGPGSGIGPDAGSGFGPGKDRGTGGGPHRPGSGVTLPRVLVEVKPQYTSDAMRAKVQGTVLLECIVGPDGAVDDVRVARSLDPTFGLDEEAKKAARRWRFAPGTRMGDPVPVLVTIELTFALR
jgi:protein TonB